MEEVFIVSIARTPIGAYGGGLSGFSATALGSHAIRAAVERAGIGPELVQDVYMGNVLSANLGQAPARQAALGAGLPASVNCTTINKVCASGMKSVMLAAQSIQLGHTDIVVAGGMESLTNVPYYLSKARWGYKYGNSELIDGLHHDGLLDVYDKVAMGVCGDATAKQYGISREAQDEFAIRSYKRSAEASAAGRLTAEIAPISIPQKKGDPILIQVDEEFTKVDFSKIPGLKPAFTPDGSVTAANASTLNDGAVAMVLMSGSKLRSLNLNAIARIVSYADAEQEPAWFTTAPAKAAPLALQRAGLNAQQIAYWEVNEAFAVVPLVFAEMMHIDSEKMNMNGGAISLGHPLGASGARITAALTQVLEQNQSQYGLAAICNGGGGSSAIVLERV